MSLEEVLSSVTEIEGTERLRAVAVTSRESGSFGFGCSCSG